MKRSAIFFPILIFFAGMITFELSAQSWTYNATASGSDYYMNFSYKSDVVCDCSRKYTVSAYRINYLPSNFLDSESGSSRDGSFRTGIGPSVTQNYNMSLIATGKNDFVFDCAVDCEFTGSGTLRRSTSSIKRPKSASASDGGTTIKVEWVRGTDIPNSKHKYKIARDTPNNFVATVSGSSRSWTDVNVAPGATHKYYVYTYTDKFGKHTSSARTAYGSTRPRSARATTGIARKVTISWDDLSEYTDEVILRRNGEQVITLNITSSSDTSFTDSDASLIPGFFYDYSIAWIKNDFEYSLATRGATQPNGRISGQILTPLTQLPIANAQVCVEQENDIEQSPAGTIYCDTTDVNGYYDVRRIYYHQEATFRITPYKENHGFSPGSYENQVLELDFPSLSLNFKDTTSFEVSGQVVQNLDGQSCGIGGIEIWVDDIFKGVKTDAEGYFSLSVEESGTYTIEPRFSGHEFVPTSQTFLVDRETTGIDFTDTRTNFLTGAVKGGCDIYIGRSMVRIYSTSGETCIDTTVMTNEAGRYEVELPARKYEVEVVEFTPETEITLDPDAILAYFPTEETDLTDESQQLNFIYRRPPEIRVLGLPADRCDQLGAAVVEQNRPYVVDIEVIESFGEASCYVESGFVLVYNEVGDRANTPDTLHLEGGKASYQLIPGKPNLIAPHHKLLQLVAHIDREIAEWTEPLLVTGVRAREQTFTTVLPEIPLMVLHDPPGDASYSFFEEGNETELGIRLFSQAEGSLTINNEVKLGNRFEAGEFVSFKTEYWGTVGGSLSMGARMGGQSEWILSTTSLERFATSGNPRITGAEGDVFVGAAFNLIYALADVLSFDPVGCTVELSTDMIMGNDGFSTTFMYTEDHIRRSLIPQLTDLRDLLLDSNLDSAQIYDNQISVWQQILENNNRNKRDAIFDENRSFSAGATYVSSVTSDTLLSGSLELSAFLDESVVIGAGFEVAGSGAKGSVETKLRIEMGSSITGSIRRSTTTGFELNDDDQGDFFSVNIKKDPMYGTPVFDLVSGRSSCPWEKGTQPRESLQLQSDDYFQTGIGAEEAAVFQLSLGNISQSEETRTYVLKFLQESNPDGAYITIGGSEAQSPIPYTLGSGAQRFATVTVRKGPRAFSYQDLQFVLTSGCEDKLIADTVALAVTFENSYPALELAKPLDEWLVNSNSDHELLVRFAGYDKSRVKKVQLQYAPLGTFALETGAQWTADELLNIAEGTTFLWNVVNLYDGHYQLRLRADYGDGDVYSAKTEGLIDRRGPELFGLPEPADGDLAPDEVIAVQFDEEIDCFSANAQKVRFESLTTGSTYPVEVGCSGGKLIIRPLWNANAHRGEMIRVTVSGLNDQYQNEQTSPVTWTFRTIDGDSPTLLDTDQDGIDDLADNCPLSANSDQSDLDNDGIGDTCDDDVDGDGILNQEDNCPYFANPTQADMDGNGIGDECEPTADGDGDGIANSEDNCPYHSNPDQADQDGDGIGDACDDDVDGDGLLNFADNCRFEPNPDQTDANGDGYGDACENTVPTEEAFGAAASVRLMPNPANNQVTIEWSLENPGDWQWQLLTLSGQVLWQMGRESLSAGRHQTEITVSDLPNGLYLLRFVTDGGMSTRKLMVLH